MAYRMIFRINIILLATIFVFRSICGQQSISEQEPELEEATYFLPHVPGIFENIITIQSFQQGDGTNNKEEFKLYHFKELRINLTKLQPQTNFLVNVLHTAKNSEETRKKLGETRIVPDTAAIRNGITKPNQQGEKLLFSVVYPSHENIFKGPGTISKTGTIKSINSPYTRIAGKQNESPCEQKSSIPIRSNNEKRNIPNNNLNSQNSDKGSKSEQIVQHVQFIPSNFPSQYGHKRNEKHMNNLEYIIAYNFEPVKSMETKNCHSNNTEDTYNEDGVTDDNNGMQQKNIDERVIVPTKFQKIPENGEITEAEKHIIPTKFQKNGSGSSCHSTGTIHIRETKCIPGSDVPNKEITLKHRAITPYNNNDAIVHYGLSSKAPIINGQNFQKHACSKNKSPKCNKVNTPEVSKNLHNNSHLRASVSHNEYYNPGCKSIQDKCKHGLPTVCTCCTNKCHINPRKSTLTDVKSGCCKSQDLVCDCCGSNGHCHQNPVMVNGKIVQRIDIDKSLTATEKVYQSCQTIESNKKNPICEVKNCNSNNVDFRTASSTKLRDNTSKSKYYANIVACSSKTSETISRKKMKSYCVNRMEALKILDKHLQNRKMSVKSIKKVVISSLVSSQTVDDNNWIENPVKMVDESTSYTDDTVNDIRATSDKYCEVDTYMQPEIPGKSASKVSLKGNVIEITPSTNAKNIELFKDSSMHLTNKIDEQFTTVVETEKLPVNDDVYVNCPTIEQVRIRMKIPLGVGRYESVHDNCTGKTHFNDESQSTSKVSVKEGSDTGAANPYGGQFGIKVKDTQLFERLSSYAGLNYPLTSHTGEVTPSGVNETASLYSGPFGVKVKDTQLFKPISSYTGLNHPFSSRSDLNNQLSSHTEITNAEKLKSASKQLLGSFIAKLPSKTSHSLVNLSKYDDPFKDDVIPNDEILQVYNNHSGLKINIANQIAAFSSIDNDFYNYEPQIDNSQLKADNPVNVNEPKVQISSRSKTHDVRSKISLKENVMEFDPSGEVVKLHSVISDTKILTSHTDMNPIAIKKSKSFIKDVSSNDKIKSGVHISFGVAQDLKENRHSTSNLMDRSNQFKSDTLGKSDSKPANFSKVTFTDNVIEVTSSNNTQYVKLYNDVADETQILELASTLPGLNESNRSIRAVEKSKSMQPSIGIISNKPSTSLINIPHQSSTNKSFVLFKGSAVKVSPSKDSLRFLSDPSGTKLSNSQIVGFTSSKPDFGLSKTLNGRDNILVERGFSNKFVENCNKCCHTTNEEREIIINGVSELSIHKSNSRIFPTQNVSKVSFKGNVVELAPSKSNEIVKPDGIISDGHIAELTSSRDQISAIEKSKSLINEAKQIKLGSQIPVGSREYLQSSCSMAKDVAEVSCRKVPSKGNVEVTQSYNPTVTLYSNASVGNANITETLEPTRSRTDARSTSHIEAVDSDITDKIKLKIRIPVIYNNNYSSEFAVAPSEIIELYNISDSHTVEPSQMNALAKSESFNTKSESGTNEIKLEMQIPIRSGEGVDLKKNLHSRSKQVSGYPDGKSSSMVYSFSKISSKGNVEVTPSNNTETVKLHSDSKPNKYQNADITSGRADTRSIVKSKSNIGAFDTDDSTNKIKLKLRIPVSCYNEHSTNEVVEKCNKCCQDSQLQIQKSSFVSGFLPSDKSASTASKLSLKGDLSDDKINKEITNTNNLKSSSYKSVIESRENEYCEKLNEDCKKNIPICCVNQNNAYFATPCIRIISQCNINNNYKVTKCNKFCQTNDDDVIESERQRDGE